MSIKQLDHLNLTVRSLEESVNWYRRLFGFEVVEKGIGDYGPWSIVRSGEAMLCIYEQQNRGQADRCGYHDSVDHRINHVGFRISDRASWEESIRENDVDVLFGGPTHWPNSLSWYVMDPNGYQIEVVLWEDGQISFDAQAA